MWYVNNEKCTQISIHALVKRATYRDVFQKVRTYYFNPRPRKEGDLQRTAHAL